MGKVSTTSIQVVLGWETQCHECRTHHGTGKAGIRVGNPSRGAAHTQGRTSTGVSISIISSTRARTTTAAAAVHNDHKCHVVRVKFWRVKFPVLFCPPAIFPHDSLYENKKKKPHSENPSRKRKSKFIARRPPLQKDDLFRKQRITPYPSIHRSNRHSIKKPMYKKYS